MTDNRTTELLPCPFCGGEASWIAAQQREDGTYYPATCGCRKCGIWHHGESDYGHGGFATEEDCERSMKQAIAEWNTRAVEEIAVTLGISNENVKALIDDMLDFIGNCCETTLDFGCCDPIDCKYLSDDGELAECTRYQDFLSRAKAIADELNAEIGGTCNLYYGEDDDGYDGWYCDGCGGWFQAVRRDGRLVKPKHCQQCGKAVKR